MPKRSCPFTESFSSQYKIHVGQKELNLHGVFGNKYRQEVYEKTKSLLFNGTKAVMERIWKVDGEGKCSDVDMSSQGHVLQPTNGQMLLKGQTLIGLDGKLKKTKPVPDAVNAPAVCGVCQRASGVRRPCSQCERPVCLACTQQCSSCSSHCCSICTVTEENSVKNHDSLCLTRKNCFRTGQQLSPARAH
uniref:Apoptosis regulatory protein Siva n=1 Tax=Pygocentrus nattereri TaxID=42514 RepID=A0A3B4CW06_PYGNA